jgi:tRNA threonylcarbamoyladenosine biosynthesis protein TsaB
MPYLLAIETATDVCSVALLLDGEVVATSEVFLPRSHAAHLVPAAQDVLRRVGVTGRDLDVIAVSAGPGSFTGLRIGVSAAKGFAFAAGASLVAVPSLDALAWSVVGLIPPDDLLIAAFPSRREEAFAAAYRTFDGQIEVVSAPQAIRLDDMESWLPVVRGRLWVAGEAAALVATSLPRETSVLDSSVVRPRAETVGRLGWLQWEGGQVEDVATFEPAYLKEFEARRGGSIFERLSQ